MTSPNEPGAPKKGDGLNGDGSTERAGVHRATPPTQSGRAADAGDAPPWQRGGPRPPQGPQRQGETPTSGPGGGERLNRFVSGTAGPKNASHDAAEGRGDGPPPPEAYASELPDLSGGAPRGGQRKAAVERGGEQTGGRAAAESREARDTRVQVGRRTRGPVRASMQIRRIDPWSTLKVSLLLSVALFFVWMIAVAFLYLVLGGMGVWSKLNSNVGDLLNNTSGSSGELVSSGTIFGGAVLIGLVNIVLLTAAATIAAFVYNLATDLIGGIEVTLADRD